MAKVVCVVSRREMAEQASALVKKLNLRNFSVVQVETNEVPALASSLAGAGIDVIIARGGQASLFKEQCSIPVVEIRLTGQEMGLLVSRAKKQSGKSAPRIAVVGYANMFSDTSAFDRLYGVSLQMYYAEVEDQLTAVADTACADGPDIMLGGDAACARAAVNGIPALFLESGEESLTEAFNIASMMAYATDLEKNNTAEVKTLLDYSFSGAIKLDMQGRVIMMNHLAEKILGGGEFGFIGRSISDIAPALSGNVLERVFRGEEIYSSVFNIGGAPTVTNIAPIKVDGAVDGIIISFHESTTIREMEAEVRRDLYRQESAPGFTFKDFPCVSRSMSTLLSEAERTAAFSCPVLITGPSGSEKELLAMAIYGSAAVKGAFAAVHCGGLTPGSMTAELFGNQPDGDRRSIRPGLIDGALNGVLFVDEPEKLDGPAQYRLYRLVKDGVLIRQGDMRPIAVGVKVIAACGGNVEALVTSGGLRPDLYRALSVLRLDIPPLSERREDILPWAKRALETFEKKHSRYIHLSAGAESELVKAPWTGELAQLEAFCERLVVSTEKRGIDEIFVRARMDRDKAPSAGPVVLFRDPKELEVRRALEESRGRREPAASSLGVSTTTLWRYMKKYNIK